MRTEEPALSQRQVLDKSAWQPDTDSDHCERCKAVFSFVLRRHHCRAW